MEIQQNSIDNHYEAIGPMQFESLTEVKEALGGENGFDVLPENLLNQYPNLMKIPIEELNLRTRIDNNQDGVKYLRYLV